MVLSAASFLLNREMKFLLLWVCLLRPQGVLPKLCVEQCFVSIPSGSRRKCSVWSQLSAQGSVCHLLLWLLLKWLNNICPVSGSACDPPARRAVNDCKELGQGRRGWRNCSAGRGMGALLMSCAKSLFQQLLMNSMSTASWLGNS